MVLLRDIISPVDVCYPLLVYSTYSCSPGAFFLNSYSQFSFSCKCGISPELWWCQRSSNELSSSCLKRMGQAPLAIIMSDSHTAGGWLHFPRKRETGTWEIERRSLHRSREAAVPASSEARLRACSVCSNAQKQNYT